MSEEWTEERKAKADRIINNIEKTLSNGANLIPGGITHDTTRKYCLDYLKPKTKKERFMEWWNDGIHLKGDEATFETVRKIFEEADNE